METFFSRYKNPLVLAFVLVAQFFLLAVQVRRPFPAAAERVDQQGVHALRLGMTTVVTPPESVLHRSGLSLRSVWSSYLDLIGVREENVQLKDEIDRLRMEQASLAEDARQGERLQDLLAFREHYVNTTVPAQVVGTAGTDRSRVLYLDKGSDDGIAPDMPVITPDGIVGRVREVYPHTAQVLEISDPTSASGVLLADTRTRGILRGNSKGQPQIVNLMPDDRIKPGQIVLTSGGDQIFPRGLPVGVVDRIVPDPDNEPMVDVVLKPAANLGRLEEVLVVTSTAPAPTDRARRDVSKSELVAAGVRAAGEARTSPAVDAQIAEVQRASEILAARLPSTKDQIDPYAPDSAPDASPATSEADARPLHPPAALHADHYTPGAIPPAESLKPGERYAPLVEGTPATERRNAKNADSGINPTDNSPAGTNPAFAAASAAMAAQRKAVADAKAEDAARRYAALHPSAVPPAEASAEQAAGNGDEAAPAVRYVDRTNANGTVTRVAVPVASGEAASAPTVRYVNRTNADGTVTRVAVPAPASASGSTPAVRYVNRTNADGTVTRLAVPAAPGAATSAPAVRYINRTNADGTVTRVAVPAASVTASGSAVRYVNRTNADGTVTRVLVPAASAGGAGGATATASKPAVRYVNRTNADGTITRVAVPMPTSESASASAVRYVNRTNADGTVTRVAVPAATTSGTGGATAPASAPAVRYVNRTNADGTITRVAVPIPASGSASASAVRYVSRTNADGTVTRVAVAAMPGAPSGSTPSAATVRYMNRTNADGTITRVAVPATSGATASTPTVRYVTRTNADGTVTRVAVPAASAAPGVSPSASGVRYVNRTNADGTITRVAVPANPAVSSSQPRPSVPTRVIADGPLPASRSTRRPAASGSAPAGSAAKPVKRNPAPAVVPDDGSRPPAPAPASRPQGQG